MQGAAISLSRYNHNYIRPRSLLAFKVGRQDSVIVGQDPFAGDSHTYVLDSLNVIASQVLDDLMPFR